MTITEEPARRTTRPKRRRRTTVAVARPAPATAAPPAEDSRTSLELSGTETADLCAGCTTCCTYITIEVDAPRQAWEYDQWIWMLHHDGVELYVERPEKWFVYIPTRCTKLDANGRCGIWGRHPVLCREYDPRACERRYPLSDTRAWFKTGEDLEDWIRRERPKHWERLEAHRGAMPQGPPKARGRAAAALVQIAGVASVQGRTRR